jgi:hypothetical protein
MIPYHFLDYTSVYSVTCLVDRAMVVTTTLSPKFLALTSLLLRRPRCVLHTV